MVCAWGHGDVAEFIAPVVNLHGVGALLEKPSGERGVQQRSAQQEANIRHTVSCNPLQVHSEPNHPNFPILIIPSKALRPLTHKNPNPVHLKGTL